MSAETAHGHPLVRVRDLEVRLRDGRRIVSGVSFTVRAGEVLGVVGQSGSGKTTVGMALLGYERHGAQISGGQIQVAGEQVRELDEPARRSLRGRRVAYVPQDPRASLNPAMRIGRQLREVLEVIDGGGARSVEERRIREQAVREALADVGLPASVEFLRRFPHQLSGGQLQRVGIAMAIVGKPPVLVLDEPTTGLDVSTQARVLRLVRRLCTEHQIAGVYVTHDLAVVADLADRVLVMHAGRVVEQATVAELFRAPRETYTRQLLAAAPDISDPLPESARRIGVADPTSAMREDSLTVSRLSAAYARTQVLHEVSFQVRPGECLAVVGESGSGKTTLSRALIGLHSRYTGEVAWRGQLLPRQADRRSRATVRALQYIFQSPYSALNPRLSVAESVAFAHRLTTRATSSERRQAVVQALRRVGLSEDAAELLPKQLSGGERQRVAIARALVTKPSMLICDEITSALDVIVQAQIMELLGRLREEGLSLLFVTHNLALVKSFADRVLVLHRGRVVEQGAVHTVLTTPQETYTRQLLAHTPSLRSTVLAT